MTVAKIDFRGSATGSESVGNWNGFRGADGSIANLKNFDTGANTGWMFAKDLVAGIDTNTSTSWTADGLTRSGDADFVDSDQVATGSLGTNNQTDWCAYKLTGLAAGEKYTIKLYPHSSSAGARIGEYRVNNETSVVINNYNNLTDAAVYTDIVAVDGEISFSFRAHSTANAFVALNAIMIEQQPTENPVVSLDGVFAPNTLESVTATNFESPPSAITFTDTANNSLVLSLTPDGNDYAFTFTDLPDQGNDSAGLLFGDVTGTITVGADTAFDVGVLQAPSGRAFATLAEGFDESLFVGPGWDVDEPAVGWQIVYPTANNTTISSLAELQTDATEQFDVWIVDLSGVWYGRYLTPNTGALPSGVISFGTAEATQVSASQPFSYNAADHTGFEYRVDGSEWATATSPILMSSLNHSTSYELDVRALNASGPGPIFSTTVWTLSAPEESPTPSEGIVMSTQNSALSQSVGYRAMKTNMKLLGDSLGQLRGIARHTIDDDFMGPTLNASVWAAVSGADGADPAIAAGVAGGVVRLTSGGGATSILANSSQLCSGLNFKAENGGLIIKARLKIDNIANATIHVGFTDSIASEMPFALDASNDLTSAATNAVCFVRDAAGSGNWYACGVKADVDAGPVNTGRAPVNATYQVLEIHIAKNGNALFFIDDVLVARVSNAVTPTALLTPVISCSDDNTAARNLDLDRIIVQMEAAA